MFTHCQKFNQTEQEDTRSKMMQEYFCEFMIILTAICLATYGYSFSELGI